jgi:hypothetical protein
MLRRLAVALATAGAVVAVHSDAGAGDFPVWIEASSNDPAHPQIMEIWAGGPTNNGQILIGNLQTRWNAATQSYVPINLIQGFHPGGHTFYNSDQYGEIHETNYHPYFCNQVVAIYSCDEKSCPTGDCLTWSGQNWSCITPSPSIQYVYCGL